MRSTTMRPFLTLFLALHQLHAAALAEPIVAPYGAQWFDTSFISAVTMDDDDNLHVVGSNCWWATLDLETFIPFHGQGEGSGVCHHLAVDKHRVDTLWIAGKSLSYL